MPYPSLVSAIFDEPPYPASITIRGASTSWLAPALDRIHVYGGNWYKILQSLPQPSSGSAGQNFARAWKSTDLGLTWAVADLTNSAKLNPFQGEQNFSVVTVGSLLYVLFQYGVSGGSVADYQLRIAVFDMATETWGSTITGGPITACSISSTGGEVWEQDIGGVKMALALDPSGLGFIIQYLSAGDNNPNVVRHVGDPYICSYVTCSFTGTWGAPVDFAIPLPQSETYPDDPTSYYGSTPHGIVVAPSGRVHFFFNSLLSNLGIPNSYRIFECNLMSGVLSGYTLVTDDVFPTNFGTGGALPDTGDPNSLVGFPKINGTELLIPYIGVWDSGASSPYDPQTNTSVKVARATSAATPVWTLQTVTTAANQGPNVGATFTTGSSSSTQANVPSLDIQDGTVAIGWIRSEYHGGVPLVPDTPAQLYYAQPSGVGWAAPVLAFTTLDDIIVQWAQFSVIDDTHAGWMYQPYRDGDGAFTPPYEGTEFWMGEVSPPLSIVCDSPPAGTVGVFYTHTFPASGGTEPYTFSIIGILPPGLTLNTTTGVVSGIPTTAGPWDFTVKVTGS